VYNMPVLADELIKPDTISVSTDTPLRHGVRRFEVNMSINCIRCDDEFERKSWQIKNSNREWLPCRRKRSRDFRKNMNEDQRAAQRAYFVKRQESGRSKIARDKWASNNKNLSNKAFKTWADKNKIKRLAHWTIENHLRNGRLKRMPCVICNNVKAQAHHEDYSKPLEVVWLCSKHHGERHYEINKQARLKKGQK